MYFDSKTILTATYYPNPDTIQYFLHHFEIIFEQLKRNPLLICMSFHRRLFNLWPVSLFVCKLPRLNICHTLV